MLDSDQIINKSLCKHCINRISRTISTEGLDMVDETGEPVSNLETDEDYITEINHEICMVLSIDLDHIVLDCTAFKSIEEESFSNFFVNKKFKLD